MLSVTGLNPLFMDTVLSSMFNTPNYSGNNALSYNVAETNEAYEIQIAAAGMKKEMVNISLGSRNELIINVGQNETEEQPSDKPEPRYLRHDFAAPSFTETFRMPDEVAKDRISAHAEDGVLYITLPKMTDEEKAKLSTFITVA